MWITCLKFKAKGYYCTMVHTQNTTIYPILCVQIELHVQCMHAYTMHTHSCTCTCTLIWASFLDDSFGTFWGVLLSILTAGMLNTTRSPPIFTTSSFKAWGSLDEDSDSLLAVEVIAWFLADWLAVVSWDGIDGTPWLVFTMARVMALFKEAVMPSSELWLLSVPGGR